MTRDCHYFCMLRFNFITENASLFNDKREVQNMHIMRHGR